MACLLSARLSSLLCSQVHIDFGFILGRDPKPMQPPFKLSKEMVAAMGGFQSRRFELFKEYCCQVCMVPSSDGRFACFSCTCVHMCK
jgi:hypothetical protein